MRIHLLGTGSAAGIPAPFCDCPTCTEARRRGGVNLRGRAGALIDDNLKIDFGPDTLLQAQLARRSLSNVKTILFTHHHEDHVHVPDLRRVKNRKPPTPMRSVDVYANAATMEKIGHGGPSDMLNLHTIAAGDAFQTAQGDEVLAMPAVHEEGAVLFRIIRNGKTLFYGHDSGPYPQTTLDALGDGVPLDVALFDCNHGFLDSPNERHMSIDDVARMAALLRQNGAITPKTRCIATHFAHQGGALHEELVQAFLPHGIEVAYDGMLIEA